MEHSQRDTWIFGRGSSAVVSKEAMLEALGPGAEAFAYTTFGGSDSPWYAETWRSAGLPIRFGIDAQGPVPFAVLLDDETEEGYAEQATSDVLARVIIDCAGADPGIAALHWRRASGDELVVARAEDSDCGLDYWYAAACFDGVHEQYACGPEGPETAWRTAAELVLRNGLTDETNPDSYADPDDRAAALAVEAWAAHVLADVTRRRTLDMGPHVSRDDGSTGTGQRESWGGFVVGADRAAAVYQG